LLPPLLATTGTIAGVPGSVIEGRVKSGTGFFVASDGLLVTSAHVVAGCPRITLWPASGAERAGRIVAMDRALDLALLSAGGEVPRYATSTPEHPRAGDPVSTIGFGALPSRPREAKVTSGNLIGDVIDAAGNRILLIRARLREGNSGGPVIDARGSLVGIVRGRDTERPEIGVATPRQTIDWFLLEQGVSPIPSTPAEGRPEDQTDLLMAMSVLVQCAPGSHDPLPTRRSLLPNPASIAEVPQRDGPIMRLRSEHFPVRRECDGGDPARIFGQCA